jgi:hypothetical protein
MYKDKIENLNRIVSSLKHKCDNKDEKKLKINLLVRCVKRIIDFSGECNECRNLIIEMEEIIVKLNSSFNSVDRVIYKDYQSMLKRIVSHMQKNHKLVSDGYYVGMYMSLGIALGLPLGLNFDNIALGIPIGLCIGITIGSAMDADAKKKGKVI